MSKDHSKSTPHTAEDLSRSKHSNVHVLPVGRKSSRGQESDQQAQLASDSGSDKLNFDQLAARLEKRITKIDSELKNSILAMEGEIQEAIRSKKLKNEEKAINSELTNLSEQLEGRIHKTLNLLSTRQKLARDEKDRLESVKKLSSQLVKILSFDFYKGVLDRLGRAEYMEEVDPFGMDQRLIDKIKPILDYLYYKYWRITTTGTENIPNEGRALIVANHSGAVPYDGAMIKTAIINEHAKRKDARFLVEDFVYHMPILGTFMYRIGGVRACQENAELLLNAEHLVVVFPEGVKGIGKYYRQRYKLQRFGRGGFIRLCMKTNSPLIPVGVVGAEEIHPVILKSNILAKTIGIPYIPITPTFPLLGLLGMIPFPTKWYIHFGKPIHVKDHGPKAIQDDLLIHKLSERVRTDIQEIIFDLLRKRRSVWLG